MSIPDSSITATARLKAERYLITRLSGLELVNSCYVQCGGVLADQAAVHFNTATMIQLYSLGMLLAGSGTLPLVNVSTPSEIRCVSGEPLKRINTRQR